MDLKKASLQLVWPVSRFPNDSPQEPRLQMPKPPNHRRVRRDEFMPLLCSLLPAKKAPATLCVCVSRGAVFVFCLALWRVGVGFFSGSCCVGVLAGVACIFVCGSYRILMRVVCVLLVSCFFYCSEYLCVSLFFVSAA